MSLPTVSVVIPTFNRAHLLDRAIRPVLDDEATSEVIVVVDGSNDGSVELLKRNYGDDRRVRTVASDHLGKAAALDVGVREASGEVIVTIDDDVVASPGGIRRHAEHHLGGSDRVVLGYMPVALGPASSRPTRMYAAAYEQRVGEYERHPFTVLPFLWGGYFSLRREMALRVPFHNPAMALDLEDNEVGCRYQLAGLVGVFDPTITADHYHARSSATSAEEYRARAAAQHLLRVVYPDVYGTIDPRTAKGRLRRGITGLPEPGLRVASAVCGAASAVGVGLLDSATTVPGTRRARDLVARWIDLSAALEGLVDLHLGVLWTRSGPTALPEDLRAKL